MASVSSLDKDLRKLRLEKYTPAAANEARQWLENTLGDKLSSPDLLQGLKDGVALCRLVNLVVAPPGIKFKKSAMPFVQMENISQFLSACQAPPLSLHQHDTFLTVDLFEQKDPAQVLQCIGAFSRAAHAINPHKFPNPIGPKTRPGTLSPQATGPGARKRGSSITSDTSSASAWNPTQYGYLGGASQGNLGISFGSRRQVIGTGPTVPTLADKERMRKKAAEEEEIDQERRRVQHLAEEEAQALAEEERRWEAETHRLKEEEERQRVLEERREWEEQERRWKRAEEQRHKEEEEAAARMEEERRQTRNQSPVKLRGQYLSQYQAEQAAAAATATATATAAGGDSEAERGENSNRIRELEMELEFARQREAEYERDRHERGGTASDAPAAKLRARSRSRPGTPRSPKPSNSSQLNRHESWTQGGEVLRTKHTKWHQRQQGVPEDELEGFSSSPTTSPRPLPDPNALAKTDKGSPRPLPDPAKYASSSRLAQGSRTDGILADNVGPAHATYSREVGGTEERDQEDRRRVQSQDTTKAGGRASKSLLEREMERERERQQEWEESQRETAAAAAKMTDKDKDGVDGIGGGIGGRWDVSQWSGYTGGDNQNKGSQGIGAARRQVVGPRPLPNGGS